jgi:multimeric flavodoxin WrbA
MKKIMVLSGSARKNGNSMKVVDAIKEQFGAEDEFEWEYIYLYDYQIRGCIGCKVCRRKEGRACPFKDDVPKIMEKLEGADGIVFASPVYSRTLTGQLKNFIDRTNHVLHRPRLSAIPSMIVSTTDIGMAKAVANYLAVIASSMGARVDGKLAVKMGAMHNDQRYSTKIEKDIIKMSEAFKKSVRKGKQQKPTFNQLLRFNFWKTRAIVEKDKYPNDYMYWKNNGWIEMPFFYDTVISPIKLLLMKGFEKRISKIVSKGVLY